MLNAFQDISIKHTEEFLVAPTGESSNFLVQDLGAMLNFLPDSFGKT